MRKISKIILKYQEENILSGEIHDTLGDCLAGIKFKVGNAQLQGGKPSNATVSEKI